MWLWELLFRQITPLSSTDRLFRWCHNNLSSGLNPLTSIHGGKSPDAIHDRSVMEFCFCKVVMWNVSQEIVAGCDRSSSSSATQSSPECMGMRSESSELPVDSDSKGWSTDSMTISTRGQFGRVHWPHGDEGTLERPSAFPWSLPARWTIENWNCWTAIEN